MRMKLLNVQINNYRQLTVIGNYDVIISGCDNSTIFGSLLINSSIVTGKQMRI